MVRLREMMENELLPALDDKSLVYQSRVAINILKIVERELEQIEALVKTETESLKSLLSEEGDLTSLNQQLVESIHRGDFDGDESKNSDLLAHFQQTILPKVAIDNPRYSTYKDYLANGKLHNY